ncbi:hypothetical protein D3C71_2154420 [compost metagenome]
MVKSHLLSRDLETEAGTTPAAVKSAFQAELHLVRQVVIAAGIRSDTDPVAAPI